MQGSLWIKGQGVFPRKTLGPGSVQSTVFSVRSSSVHEKGLKVGRHENQKFGNWGGARLEKSGKISDFNR